MNQTKLEVALKNFSRSVPNFRRDKIAQSAASGVILGLGAAAPLAYFAKSGVLPDYTPALANLAISPILGATAAVERAKALDRDQYKIDNYRDQIDNVGTYMDITNQYIGVNPNKLDKYLPKDKVEKLNAEYQQKLNQFPLDKSDKKLYKHNKLERRGLKYNLIDTKMDLFFDNNHIGK